MTWTTTLWLDDIAPVDHEELGLSRLLGYLADKPRMRSLLEALLGQVASLEGAAVQLLTLRSIWTATGDQLDTLGRIVGQLRAGLVDAEYRLMILGRIFVNRGDGTLDQFDDLLTLLEVPGWSTYEFWPAALEVSAYGATWVFVIADLLFALKGGGVRLNYVYAADDESDLFTTASTLAADQLDADRGFANLAGLTGGMLPDMRWER